MYNPLKNFSDSLNNNQTNGWSGRKLTAFTLTGCIVALHVFYFMYSLMLKEFSLFVDVLIIDLIGVAFFLGLVTVANIIELRGGKSKKEDNSETVQ